MRDGVLLLAVLAACYLGFAMLALSQDRHWYHLDWRRHCPLRAILPLRMAGYGLLFAALVLALVRDGPGFGALLWATMISIGALAVVCTLTWWPSWLRPLVRLFQHLD